MTEEDKTGLKIKDILENVGHCIWGKSTLEDKQHGKTLFCWQRIKGKQLDYCLMIFLWSSRRWRICLPWLLCLKSQDQYLEWDVPLSRGYHSDSDKFLQSDAHFSHCLMLFVHVTIIRTVELTGNLQHYISTGSLLLLLLSRFSRVRLCATP